mmetsp:Transcript_20705/g.39985  ORF Transcript_20705/g.39985 Transcript_20705/m.39985 type:complete len:245 (-) Transcript_20705:203-937(-)
MPRCLRVLLSFPRTFQSRTAIRALERERGNVDKLLVLARLPGNLDYFRQRLIIRRAELTCRFSFARSRNDVIVDSVVHKEHALLISLPLRVNVRLQRHDIHGRDLHLIVLAQHGKLDATAPFRRVHDFPGVLIWGLAQERLSISGSDDQRRADLAERRGVAHRRRRLAGVAYRCEETAVVVRDGYSLHQQAFLRSSAGWRGTPVRVRCRFGRDSLCLLLVLLGCGLRLHFRDHQRNSRADAGSF